jgi:hypothetical protein
MTDLTELNWFEKQQGSSVVASTPSFTLPALPTAVTTTTTTASTGIHTNIQQQRMYILMLI